MKVKVMIKSNLQGILVILVSIALVACGSGNDNVLSNDVPTASEVRIIDNNGGDVVVGDTLSGSYIYSTD